MDANDSTYGHTAFVFLSGIVIGAVTGLAFGLLSAPDSGAATRQKILRKAGHARTHVSEVIDDLETSGKDFLHDVKASVIHEKE